MATDVIKIQANIVSKGDILVYARKKYTIVYTLHFGSTVQLQYDGGYFNFNEGRIVEIVDKRIEMPTIGFPNQIHPVFLPVENNMETLNIQNAIEAQRILLQKLEQMLDLQQLAPTEDGKIAIGNCNIRVDKASIVKAARDEMKVAASKSAELIKKL
ncbi:hypothetical protein QNG98_gp18 [Yersinia phage PYps3T]|uniref:Uncharacterized protein n=2 Tax=Carltongylesvirus TaxID=2732960 RepID=A0AAE7TQX9_9CAUD|nr:hypothetical protein QNG98_gp18 [Yersinia phage PYps3T]YP_010844596.1 hypothetical protein QNG99_gp18 [Yersinia phage PYps23T]QQO91106.1 hypothetical protein ORF019 [Yersinia phage PYps4T]QQO91276.1 hypothetical protein ORF019 [Yersinia phage PYps16T]QQO90937.1 hypothetical protein ORF018 [Yersinia phage PYps23T]QQO91020.1 hypothetical protein ORF018 [Yersinia phage PYps3T]